MVYFIQAGAPTSIEHTNFGPILIIFVYFVENLLEHKTCDILAAELLRLIIDSSKVVCCSK